MDDGNFGVRIKDEEKAKSLEIRKLWNNFMIVADFHLFNTFGEEGDYVPFIKAWIYDNLKREKEIQEDFRHGKS